MMGWIPRTRAWAASRRGNTHVRNEDAFCILDSPARAEVNARSGVVYGLADGVSTGGMGQWASDVAMTRMSQFFERTSGDGQERLTEIIGEIDWELRGHDSGKAACTLAAIWVHGSEVHLFQVGDSHVFRVRGDEVHKITQGDLCSEASLNQFLGMGPAVSEVMYTVSGPVEPGDVFVLVTDGLSSVLDVDGLPALWQGSGRDPAGCAQSILGAACRAEVDDDATVLVVMVLD
jgi:serine/threonine protein phosphatase PrpC